MYWPNKICRVENSLETHLGYRAANPSIQLALVDTLGQGHCSPAVASGCHDCLDTRAPPEVEAASVATTVFIAFFSRGKQNGTKSSMTAAQLRGRLGSVLSHTDLKTQRLLSCIAASM